MAEVGVADVAVTREGRDAIHVVGLQQVGTRRKLDLRLPVGDVVQPHERAVDILPVPVGIVYGQADVENQRM